MKITIFFVSSILILGTFGIAQESFASHNANLFVSAENPAFDNYFSGPMVIEVVVNDPDIIDTDEAKGEPDVTVNGKDLRMVQAVDGKWYAFFADKTSALNADATELVNSPTGTQFGVGCTATSASDIAGIDFSDTVGIFFPRVLNTLGGGTSSGVLDNCTGDSTSSSNTLLMNVLRGPPTPSSPPSGLGQLGINDGSWGFIQLYDFVLGGNVVVQYFKGGGSQNVILTFDEEDEIQTATIEFDQLQYPFSVNPIITVIDATADRDPDLADFVSASVTSSTDSVGIDVTLTETGTNTIHFSGFVILSETDESSGHILRVSNCDIIQATYKNSVAEATAGTDCNKGGISELQGQFYGELSFLDETVEFYVIDGDANTNSRFVESIVVDIVDAKTFVVQLEIVAFETSGNTGIFEGGFPAEDYPFIPPTEPAFIGLKYKIDEVGSLLDTHRIGCASIMPTYQESPFYWINWDADEYCLNFCGRVIIYDPFLAGNEPSVGFTMKWDESDRELEAYKISMGEDFYGFSRNLGIPDFQVGDEIEVIYNDASDSTIIKACPIPPINGFIDDGFGLADFSSSQITVPFWIKTNAGWWADGQINDDSFVEGIKYLIKEDIMRIPETKAGTGTSQEIPSWIKQNADWWSQGQITDESFVNGVQWLIENGIMKIG